MLRQTPLVLQMFGVENLPVMTTYNVMEKVIDGKHHLPTELVRQIPASMAEPIMVFRSDAFGGEFVLMLDLKDENGAAGGKGVSP